MESVLLVVGKNYSRSPIFRLDYLPNGRITQIITFNWNISKRDVSLETGQSVFTLSGSPRPPFIHFQPLIASGPRHFISRGHRPWSWTKASFVGRLFESNKDLKVSRPGLPRRHGRTLVSIRAQSCDANDFHVVPLLQGAPLRGGHRVSNER